MFDAPQPLLYQLRKNLKAWSSFFLFLYFHVRNIPKTRTHSLLTHSHPCIIFCHPLCFERVRETGYKLGHRNDAD